MLQSGYALLCPLADQWKKRVHVQGSVVNDVLRGHGLLQHFQRRVLDLRRLVLKASHILENKSYGQGMLQQPHHLDEGFCLWVIRPPARCVHKTADSTTMPCSRSCQGNWRGCDSLFAIESDRLTYTYSCPVTPV
eukprot:6492225-Amphidinium_carterae.4